MNNKPVILTLPHSQLVCASHDSQAVAPVRDRDFVALWSISVKRSP